MFLSGLHGGMLRAALNMHALATGNLFAPQIFLR
jgi:hypothetical protein